MDYYNFVSILELIEFALTRIIHEFIILSISSHLFVLFSYCYIFIAYLGEG